MVCTVWLWLLPCDETSFQSLILLVLLQDACLTLKIGMRLRGLFTHCSIHSRVFSLQGGLCKVTDHPQHSGLIRR